MKIAQMIATVPDLLPPEFATELQKLQAAAPPMGRLSSCGGCAPSSARLGEPLPLLRPQPAAAASLGQVTRRSASMAPASPASSSTRHAVAVEADLGQLGMILSVQRRFSPRSTRPRSPRK